MIALRPRLGLGIGGRRVSAVLIDGDTVRWAAARPRTEDEPLAHTIGALLAACPRSRLRPPIVVAAVGPAAAQLKLVTDLPPLAQRTALAAVVREHASRFFLKNGIPLLFSEVRTISPTSVWIASFEEPVVRDAIVACNDAGLTLRMVTPAAIALRLATTESAILWNDDDVDLVISYVDGIPAIARSAPSTERPHALPRFLPAFAALIGREAELMDAAGAARVPRMEPIALRGQGLRLTKEPTRRRLAVSGAVCVAAIVSVLLVPAIASWHVTRQAHVLDAAVQRQVRGAERDARELASVTSALGALAAFTQSRRSLTLLLAQLTRALPEGSALLAFQLDSAGTGSIVAVAPRAAAVVDAVERVPGFASPEIVGPVTREAAAGKQLDRVTVRFHVVPDGAP